MFIDTVKQFHLFADIIVDDRTTDIHNEIKVFGSYFKEYEDRLRLANDAIMILNVNNLKSEKEVLQWYVDMNAGGTPHVSEEIERVKQMIEKL